MQKTLVLVCVQLLVLAISGMAAENYSWNSVQIHGGGYVTGFAFSKAAKGVLYARTDVGGAYIWQPLSRTWQSLSDAWGATGDWGVLSIATDPVDADRVYMATGRGTGKIRISDDRGKTWTAIPVSFRIDGNMAGRGTGERLVIDPNLPNQLWYGSFGAGLWRSSDRGQTWTEQTSFVHRKINWIVFDSSSGVQGKATSVMYAGVADALGKGDTLQGNIYRSTDAGATWKYVPGQPLKVLAKVWFAADQKHSRPAVPARMAIAGEHMWFTFTDELPPGATTGALWKYTPKSGTWTQVFPLPHEAQGGYCALAVHPTDSRTIVVGSLGRWWPRKDEMHITTDAGATWRNINDSITWGNPYGSQPSATSWMSDVQIDPFDANHAVFNSGASTHQTQNLLRATQNRATQWDLLTKGIEETVIIGLTSNYVGAPLYSAIGDIGGFRHYNPDSVARLKWNSGSGNTYNIDFAEQVPSFMVRTHDGGGASYSLDTGANWKAFATQPARVKRGRFISAAPNARVVVWAAADSFVYRSADTGKSWQQIQGLPIGARPIADRRDSRLFYVLRANEGRVLRSTDSAKSFVAMPEGFPRTGSGAMLMPEFAATGKLWVSLGANGLHKSLDSGRTWSRIQGIGTSNRISQGKSAEGSIYPTLFLQGTVNGVQSLWCSTDQGVVWASIHDSTKSPQSLHRVASVLAGDRQVFGRLFVGTGGRGIFYGIPQATPVSTQWHPMPMSTSKSKMRSHKYLLDGSKVQ